jgi:hypothetical protein
MVSGHDWKPPGPIIACQVYMAVTNNKGHNLVANNVISF